MFCLQIPVKSSFRVPSTAPQSQNNLCSAFPLHLPAQCLNQKKILPLPYLGVSKSQLWRFFSKHPANRSPGSDRNSGRQHHMTQVTSSCLWDS